MNALKTLIADNNGDPSTMRVVVLILVMAIVVPKVYVAIATKNPVVFDTTDLEMIGLVLGAKAAQSFAENKNPATPETPTTPPVAKS
jgi:hypothetical protein